MTESNGPVQVYLVAPALTCWGLSRLLHTAAPNLVLVGTSHSLTEAIGAVERDLPDVLLFDLDDVAGNVALVREAYERTRVRMIALAVDTSDTVVQELLAAGACTPVSKRATPSELLRLVFEVCEEKGQRRVAPAPEVLPDVARPARAHALDHASLDGLTPRERETVAALTADPSAPVKVVADRLHVSEHTLRNHLTAIYAKLGVSGRLHLHAYATSGFAPLR